VVADRTLQRRLSRRKHLERPVGRGFAGERRRNVVRVMSKPEYKKSNDGIHEQRGDRTLVASSCASRAEVTVPVTTAGTTARRRRVGKTTHRGAKNDDASANQIHPSSGS